MKSIEGTTLALKASLGNEDGTQVAMLLIVDVSDLGNTLGVVMNDPTKDVPWTVYQDDGDGGYLECASGSSLPDVESWLSDHPSHFDGSDSTVWDCSECGSEFSVYKETTVGESCGDEGIACSECGSPNVKERS